MNPAVQRFAARMGLTPDDVDRIQAHPRRSHWERGRRERDRRVRMRLAAGGPLKVSIVDELVARRGLDALDLNEPHQERGRAS